MKLPVLIPLGGWKEPVLRVEGPETADPRGRHQNVQLSILRPGEAAVGLFLNAAALEALVEALVEASDSIPDAEGTP